MKIIFDSNVWQIVTLPDDPKLDLKVSGSTLWVLSKDRRLKFNKKNADWSSPLIIRMILNNNNLNISLPHKNLCNKFFNFINN